MDNFLDTCIIMANLDRKDKFHKNSQIFIESNQNLIISIYQEKKEIPFLFFRKEKIITELIKVSAMPHYNPDLKNLTIKDQIKLKRKMAEIKLQEVSQEELFEFKEDILLLKREIMYFINNKISRKIVPLEKIDLELVKKIKEKIQNEADSKILSSAIQEHKENKLRIITNDIHDWRKETLIECLKETEYKEIPEIKYLF